jgi:putative transposase
MILAKQVQIHPSFEVVRKLWEISYLCKDLWNAALEQRRDPKSRGCIDVYSQKRELPAIKKELPEYKAPASQVLQNVIFGLDRAYKMYFTKRKTGDHEARPPKFKSYKRFFTQEYSQYATCFAVTEQNVLKLAYGSKPADWLEIELPASLPGKPKTCVISRKNKTWYACFTYEVETLAPVTDGEIIWFDPGCKRSLTGIKSTGEFVEYDLNPLRRVNMETYRLIDRLASERDTKKRGSYRWRRLNARIKKLFSKINTRTKSYGHTLANRILSDHPDVRAFLVGDWDKRKTLADTEHRFVNRRINRAVQNNNPIGKLIGILDYKTTLRGRLTDKFDERGSTRNCVMCGHVHKHGIDPAARTFKCESCGFTYGRDHHSCLNFVKRFAPALWQRLSGNLPDRSVRTGFDPFSLKPRVAQFVICIQNTGCSSFQ